jgi:hypothetical protein
MKNHIFNGATMVLFGLLIAFGPQFLFKACEVTADSIPRCHWSCQAEIGIGMIIAMLGICLIVFNDLKTRMGLAIGIFFVSILALLIPHVLIGGCSMMTMACRRVAFPVLSVICVLVLVGTVVNMVYLDGKTKTTTVTVEEISGR